MNMLVKMGSFSPYFGVNIKHTWVATTGSISNNLLEFTFGLFFSHNPSNKKTAQRQKPKFQHFQSDCDKNSPNWPGMLQSFVFIFQQFALLHFFCCKVVQVAGRLVVGFNIVHKLHETLFSHKVVGHSKLRIEEHVMQIVVHPDGRLSSLCWKKNNTKKQNERIIRNTKHSS